MIKNQLKLAMLQMTSSSTLEENLIFIEQSLVDAKNLQIDLLVLPENFAFMERYPEQKLTVQEPFEDGPVQTWLSELSKKHAIWIVAGSFPICSGNLTRPYARCLVYNPKGQLETFYDKIHLFDVEVAKGETYYESEHCLAGSEPKMFTIRDFKIGLSICYDLRFPELYRHYLTEGANLLLVPSAFTKETGERHWQLLLEARAVENLCFVAGVNQTGKHDNGRETFGHTMLIGPWGDTAAELGEETALLVAELELETLGKIRQRFPAVQHLRLLPD